MKNKLSNMTSPSHGLKGESKGWFKGQQPVVARLRQLLASFSLLVMLTALMLVGSFGLPAQDNNQVAAQSAQPTFKCGNSFYISSGDNIGDPSQLSLVVFSGQTASLQNVGSPAGTFDYNGIGFNHLDGYIYGVSSDNNPGEILRIGSDGSAVSLGIPAGLPVATNLVYNSGAVGDNDRYFIHPATAGGTPNNDVYEIDISTATPTIVATHTFSSFQYQDFDFNPRNGMAYSFDGSIDRVVQINLSTNIVTPVGPVITSIGSNIGAIFFDSADNMYVEASNGKIFRIAITSFVVTELADGPSVSRVDGTSCPYAPTITKDATPRTVVAGGEVTYSYTISNGHPTLPITGLDFSDTMDSGRTYIAGSLDNSEVGGTANSYGGTNSLTITDITIPPNSSQVVTVKVKIPNDITGTVTLKNQACIEGGGLGNLAQPIFDEICSDDPTTPAFGDPTNIEVNPAPPIPGPPETGLNKTNSNQLVISFTIIGIVVLLAIIARLKKIGAFSK
ncbi:hypothetical protein H6800_02630 [Candidatus Nomurabacteria bacterium]|jgi:uncharacterized repeat protein (TIGR01451 family)|nr:hypothetical protein [Candidatus Nomurabacteria bacterium]